MKKGILLFSQLIFFLILSLIICKEGYKEDPNISKMKEILNDSPESEKDFDLLFLIDATGSMTNYIRAAKDEAENISIELRNLYPEYNFRYGYIFYRDPIDSPNDIHEIIDLTDKVNDLPKQINEIVAKGGEDIPEDWVGAFKLVNEKIKWRNGLRVIIHLADAGAHGKEFTLSDKYPLEGEKLISELIKCSQKKIKIFGFVITEDARNSFNQCQKYYRDNGGSYEIYDLKKNKNFADLYYSEVIEPSLKISKITDDPIIYPSEKPDDITFDIALDSSCKTQTTDIKGFVDYSKEYSDSILSSENIIISTEARVSDKNPAENHFEDSFSSKNSIKISGVPTDLSEQEIINRDFRKKVIDSVKKVIP